MATAKRVQQEPTVVQMPKRVYTELKLGYYEDGTLIEQSVLEAGFEEIGTTVTQAQPDRVVLEMSVEEMQGLAFALQYRKDPHSVTIYELLLDVAYPKLGTQPSAGQGGGGGYQTSDPKTSYARGLL